MSKFSFLLLSIFLCFCLIGCEFTIDITLEEHYNYIKKIIEEDYTEDIAMYGQYEIYTVYDEQDDYAYFLIEFELDRAIFIKIDKSNNKYYTHSHQFSWKKCKSVFVPRDDGYMSASFKLDYYDKDKEGNINKYHNSPYNYYNVLEEKLYLLFIYRDGKSEGAYVPAIKKGNNFLNLISMEEFEYFPIAELHSVPYMDISFDVKI